MSLCLVHRLAIAIQVLVPPRFAIADRREKDKPQGRRFELFDTIAKMCRFSVPLGYQHSKPPEKPKLGPLMPVIDAILASDRSAPPKQRHTAKPQQKSGGWAAAMPRCAASGRGLPEHPDYQQLRGAVAVGIVLLIAGLVAKEGAGVRQEDGAVAADAPIKRSRSHG